MKFQSGMFVMLSLLARSQVNFHLKGTCPKPETPSSRLELNSTVNYRYHTAIHYNSEMDHVQIFNVSEFVHDLNCVSLEFTDVSDLKLELLDCELYQGRLDWTDQQNYNLWLKNTGHQSECQNRTIEIENIWVWSDEKSDILIFWSCTNDTKLTSHKQGVVVFVHYHLLTPDWKGNIDVRVFTRLSKFVEKTLKFTGLNIKDFDINERLKHDTSCGKFKCTNKCVVVGHEGLSLIGPILLCALILVCVIIICLVVFKFNLAFWFKFC